MESSPPSVDAVTSSGSQSQEASCECNTSFNCSAFIPGQRPGRGRARCLRARSRVAAQGSSSRNFAPLSSRPREMSRWSSLGQEEAAPAWAAQSDRAPGPPTAPAGRARRLVLDVPQRVQRLLHCHPRRTRSRARRPLPGGPGTWPDRRVRRGGASRASRPRRQRLDGRRVSRRQSV